VTSRRVTVLSLNVLNIVDRWPERLPLLITEFAGLQPALAGLQEIVYPVGEDRIIASGGAARYEVRRGWGPRPEFGNSILVREDLARWLAGPASADDRLDLGLGRCAHRVELRFPDVFLLRLVNTHLHHVVEAEGERKEQAGRIVGWLDSLARADATVVAGDFNGEPHEPVHARMRAAGMRSAYAEANGAEPDVTWPSGLVAPAMDTDGPPGCLDYVWLGGAVRALSARLAFDRPAAGDPTLYPSDHRGVFAELELGR
jgi:endonuclease/exonuclease/phosphatase family metal-dependent hydrolase